MTSMATDVDIQPELFDATRLWKPVEYEPDNYTLLVKAFRHQDGSITYIVHDDDCGDANPRNFDGNVATLIQKNTICIDVDDDEAGLQEAYDRFSGYGCHDTSAPTWGRGVKSRYDREHMMRRYIAMFRPDILYYQDYWSAGEDSYGWGYITKANWEKHMLPPTPDPANAEALQQWLEYAPSMTPEDVFRGEVDLYGLWASGDVYGAIHVRPNGTEDACWGFLGYDSLADIAMQMTSSPIIEEL